MLQAPLHDCRLRPTEEDRVSKVTIGTTQDEIIGEVEIKAPIERVFAALSSRDQLIRWFTDPGCPTEVWEFEARAGGRWRFVTADGGKPVNGVTQFEAEGEIIEIEPPHRLIYSWAANWHQDPARKTIVRWDLTSTPEGTIVKVTHSGLAGDSVAHQDYSGGWIGVLESLRTFSEDTAREPGLVSR
jgi:uncharacterized protein YndB with AHSA1/START domain